MQAEPDCKYFTWRIQSGQCQLLSDFKTSGPSKFLDSGFCIANPPDCQLFQDEAFIFSWDQHLAGKRKTNTADLCREICLEVDSY